MAVAEPSFSSSSAQIQRTELALLLCQYRAQKHRLGVRAGELKTKELGSGEAQRRERERLRQEADARREQKRLHVLEMSRLAALERQRLAPQRREQAIRDDAEIAELKGALRRRLHRIASIGGDAATRTAAADAEHIQRGRAKERQRARAERAALRSFNRGYAAERAAEGAAPPPASLPSTPGGSSAGSERGSRSAATPQGSPRAAAPAVSAAVLREEAELEQRLAATEGRAAELRRRGAAFAAWAQRRVVAARELGRLPAAEAAGRERLAGAAEAEREEIARGFRSRHSGFIDGMPLAAAEAILERQIAERAERMQQHIDHLQRQRELRGYQITGADDSGELPPLQTPAPPADHAQPQAPALALDSHGPLPPPAEQ
eukprot:TRINITY_DN93_c1_g1_i1.p2 TRINITY_DN93_c1_g1~~TRINITY_DN93_c1_g1_i1.p2  ORF type:complete len:399 (+),score=148.79 TRINITY_DN93_c1_g1_i1:69-1199(+)